MNFYEKLRKLVDWMEKNSIEEPPVGLHFDVTNVNIIKNDDTDHMCEFNIWTELQSDYVDNLKRIMIANGSDSIIK